jgi:signal transduction histidine kinase
MISINEHYKKQDELRRKIVVSRFCYACAFANFVAVLPDMYYGLWLTISMGIATTIFFLLMNVVNFRYSTNVAANLLLFIGNLIVFVFANLIGKESNSHYLFLISILFVPFMLDVRNKFSVIFHAFFPFLLLTILEVTNFSVFSPLPDISAEQKAVFGAVNVVVMLLISPAVIFSIIKTHTSNRDMILKMSEETAEKNAELAKTNAELDRFVYSVSHDLRSPIASILGLVYLSKAENDLATLKYYEELKEKSLKKLDGFISDILDYSRNARVELKAEKIDWELFIDQQLAQQKHSEEAKLVQITFEIDTKQDFYVDRYRLGIIFGNLLSNAIRYRDNYKEKQTIHIKIIAEKENTKIIFADNGIGIGQEHIDKIFKMFYRASADSKGSGLGLYIVYETIQKLNGKISVDSQLGQGTMFVIELPNRIP